MALFSFTSVDELPNTLSAKFVSNGIIDSDVQVQTANKILATVPDSAKATASDKNAAGALVEQYADAYLGSLKKPATTAQVTNPNVADAPTSTDDTGEADSIPSGATLDKATDVLKAQFADMQSKAANAYVKGIITIAPKPAERLMKDGKPLMMTINKGEAKKLEEWKKRGFVPADADKEFQAALAAAKKPEKIAVYVNEKARPAIGGYIIHDESRPDGSTDYAVARKGYSLLGKLARLYGSRLEPNGETANIGAYISRREKLNNKTVRGRKSFVIKFVGVNDYFNANPDGIKVWDYDEKEKEFNVKSKLSFTLYKPTKADKSKPDTNKTRTVRLSGKVTMKLLQANASLDDDMIKAGIKVNTGESAIGSNTMPAQDSAKEADTTAAVIATLATMVNKNDKAFEKDPLAKQEAADILELLNKEADNTSAQPDGEDNP